MPPPALGPAELGLLVVAGLFAGLLNAVAGAGSMLTLPVLMWTGLDAAGANATNRVAVLAQSIAAAWTLTRAGHREPVARGFVLSLAMVPLAVVGTWVAAQVSERVFRLSLAAAIAVFVGLASLRPTTTRLEGPVPGRVALGLAALGFYGGYLQAGVGVLTLLYLDRVHHVPLWPANAVKHASGVVLMAISLVVFWAAGVSVDVVRATVLTVAIVTGTVVGTRLGLQHGEGPIRWAMRIALLAVSLRLAWEALHGFR